MDNLEVGDSITEEIKSDPASHKKTNWLGISVRFIAVLLVLGSIFFMYNKFLSEEAKVKRVVTKYVKAIQRGESTYDYKKSLLMDDFIDVIDYKYIRVVSKEKREVTLTVDRKMYDSYVKYEIGSVKDFDTFEEFFEYERSEAAKREAQENTKYKIINETDSSFTYTWGSTYDEYELLYDMQLTNGLGGLVYKKVYFTIDNEQSDTFKISSTYY